MRQGERPWASLGLSVSEMLHMCHAFVRADGCHMAGAKEREYKHKGNIYAEKL